MMLRIKKRTPENTKKKVLIYGADGSGKSTYAEKYCKVNRLKPICVDIEDTNFTDVPIVDLKMGNDKIIVRGITNIVKEVKDSADYDTIIIDGVSTLLELLVSNANGLAKYSDRASNFKEILNSLLESGLNVIFIGQIDMEVVYNDENQSNKQVIKINSLVNEKYLCTKVGSEFKTETKKLRRVENSNEAER